MTELNTNNKKQTLIQQSLLAFVMIICLGLLMVPGVTAHTPHTSEPAEATSASPSLERGYGASRAQLEGQRP